MKSLRSRYQIMSSIVLAGGVMCFFMGGTILLSHQQFFSSWWLIDRLLFALPTHFFLSLLGVTKQKRIYMGYFFVGISSVLLAVTVVSGQFGSRTLLLGILWGVTGWYMYRRQRQRLLSRRRRSAWGYIGSQVPLRGSCVSLLTTISVISTIGHTGINCSQIEYSLRLSGFQQEIDMSMGSFLGADAFLTSQEPSSGTNTTGGTEPGLLGLLGVVKSEIYDLIIEQKDLLNHSLCGVINNQLVAIQHRPWRQVAGIILLYILIRPLISVLTRLCMPLWIMIRNILVRTKLIKKQKKRVMITGLVLE